ncbi:MAG: succinate dehydrogenase cytochrome b subunit [Bacteroidia bacterium]|nr:succinate dehydrogenase cytochrome b subunit [Bacteroidia bacterium]MCZ2277672.1 succinate dehydrogenase cytochrome b subunit [Bacteroidia bacterium]
MSLKKIFNSSTGRKAAMGLTGLFLISFLVVHCAVNALIFLNDGGDTFNRGAHFMSSNPVIRTLEIVLFLGVIWHIVQALVITRTNQKARPVAYAVVNANASSKWYSRWMGLLGTLILMFLIIHLKHFWIGSRFTGLQSGMILIDGREYENMFGELKLVFSKGIVVIIYCLAMVSLAYHLLQGFQSSFHSLGLKHKKYTPVVETAGVWFSILVPLIFALMPVSIYFGWIS